MKGITMSKATKIDEQLLAELLNSPVSMATTPQKRGADGRFIDSRPKEDCKILVSLTLGQREYIKKFAKLHGLSASEFFLRAALNIPLPVPLRENEVADRSDVAKAAGLFKLALSKQSAPANEESSERDAATDDLVFFMRAYVEILNSTVLCLDQTKTKYDEAYEALVKQLKSEKALK
jgi:hypothetical protein